MAYPIIGSITAVSVFLVGLFVFYKMYRYKGEEISPNVVLEEVDLRVILEDMIPLVVISLFSFMAWPVILFCGIVLMVAYVFKCILAVRVKHGS